MESVPMTETQQREIYIVRAVVADDGVSVQVMEGMPANNAKTLGEEVGNAILRLASDEFESLLAGFTADDGIIWVTVEPDGMPGAPELSRAVVEAIMRAVGDLNEFRRLNPRTPQLH
jgi:hypothetical protein